MRHVALRIGGRYLRLGSALAAEPEEERVYADGQQLDDRTVFERLQLGHGRVALRTLDGRYLARRPDGARNFGLYPEYQLTSAAAFEEILWPGGLVSLRGTDLTYVGAVADGPVTANRTVPGLAERLRYVEVPAELVPAAEQPAAPAAAPARVPAQATARTLEPHHPAPTGG